jgi:hypothetical protein
VLDEELDEDPNLRGEVAVARMHGPDVLDRVRKAIEGRDEMARGQIGSSGPTMKVGM